MAIDVTGSAAEKIRETMRKEQMAGLRLGVRGGGCSGFSYVIRFEREGPGANDHTFEFGGARVFVDRKSMLFLDGMKLDYKNTLMEQTFVFINPNATKTCGCGISFSA